MDIFRKVELGELLVLLVYLLLTRNKHPHATQATFAAMASALLVDIYWLHGHKTPLVWVALNVPFLVMLYEKIFRKFILAAYARLCVFMLAARRES